MKKLNICFYSLTYTNNETIKWKYYIIITNKTSWVWDYYNQFNEFSKKIVVTLFCGGFHNSKVNKTFLLINILETVKWRSKVSFRHLQ